MKKLRFFWNKKSLRLTTDQQFWYSRFLNCTPNTYRDLQDICSSAAISLPEGRTILESLLKSNLVEIQGDINNTNCNVLRKFAPNEPNYQLEILSYLKDTYLKNRPKDLTPMLLKYQNNYWQSNLDLKTTLTILVDKNYIKLNGRTHNLMGKSGDWRSLGTFLQGISVQSELTLNNTNTLIRGEIDTAGLNYLQTIKHQGKYRIDYVRGAYLVGLAVCIIEIYSVFFKGCQKDSASGVLKQPTTKKK